jgi:V/A-type H+-transporting ATPase subunit K
VREEGKPVVAKRDPIETAAFALGAAIVTGIACVAAGVAVGRVGAAALGAVSERPELLGRTLIFVGLAEGIAIYGLIVAIMLMGYLK